MRSQKVVADWFAANGFPHAESAGAGRSGNDVTGAPGLRVEVKARRGFSPLSWLRQVRAGAETWNHGVPFVVFRNDGQGEANVGEWGVLLRLDDMTTLLHEAGYGSEGVAAEGPEAEHNSNSHASEEGDSEDDHTDGLKELPEGHGLPQSIQEVTHGRTVRP